MNKEVYAELSAEDKVWFRNVDHNFVANSGEYNYLDDANVCSVCNLFKSADIHIRVLTAEELLLNQIFMGKTSNRQFISINKQLNAAYVAVKFMLERIEDLEKCAELNAALSSCLMEDVKDLTAQVKAMCAANEETKAKSFKPKKVTPLSKTEKRAV